MTTYKDLCNAWENDINTKNRIRDQLIQGAVKFRNELTKDLGLENKTCNSYGAKRVYVYLAPSSYKSEEKFKGNNLNIPMHIEQDILYIEYVLCLILEIVNKSYYETDVYIPFKNYIENENLIIQVNDGRPQSDKTRFEIPVTTEYRDTEAAFQAPVEKYKQMILEKYKAKYKAL